MNSETQKLSDTNILYNIVGQPIENIIFKMADGGHFEFEALTELAGIFARGMGDKLFI